MSCYQPLSERQTRQGKQPAVNCVPVTYHANGQGFFLQIAGIASPCQAELDSCTRNSKSLVDQLSTMRTFYERASEKAHSLRQSLKTCRKCLNERDTQLDVANRIIEKLAKERATLEVCGCYPSPAG